MSRSMISQILDERSTRKGLGPRQFNDAVMPADVEESTHPYAKGGDYLPDVSDWAESLPSEDELRNAFPLLYCEHYMGPEQG